MFGCIPQISFCHFFCSMNLFIFGLKDLDTGFLVNTTSPVVLVGSL